MVQLNIDTDIDVHHNDIRKSLDNVTSHDNTSKITLYNVVGCLAKRQEERIYYNLHRSTIFNSVRGQFL